MDLLEILRTAHGGAALSKMAEHAGLTAAEADRVVAQVLPELSRQIERNTLSRGGLADLLDLLGSANFGSLLDEPDSIGSETVRNYGKAILGQIVGTKHGSRVIAKRAAQLTGLPAEKIEYLMPEIAVLSIGGLQRQTAPQFGDIFSQFPQNGGRGGEQSPLPLPEELPGNSDWGFDWQPGQSVPSTRRQAGGSGQLDGGFANQQPLPVPGGPSSDDLGPRGGGRDGGFRDLSDILRRRGGRLPQQTGGGSLWGILREIIASAMGFKNGGAMSWIIRLILFRVAWPILRRMLFGR
jgi:hypothetical protein